MSKENASSQESNDVHECPVDECDYTSTSKAGSRVHFGKSHRSEEIRDTLIDELQRLATELGHIPTRDEMVEVGKFTRTPYDKHFDGWNNSLKAAGLELNRDPDITKEKLITGLKRASNELGRPPRRSEICDYSEYGEATFVNYFDGWNPALEAAGLETWDHPSGKDHPNWEGGKDEFECPICGDTYLEYPSLAERKKTCGDSDCTSEYWSKNYSGENAPGWKGGLVDIECEICGDDFPVKQHTADYRVTCGADLCVAEYRRQIHSGEGSPRWNRVDTQCANCGTLLQIKRSRFESYENNFCSPQCDRVWRSENLVGEDNPLWEGGHQDDYGPNWDEQRLERIERDGYECIICDMTRDEHYNIYGRDFHVHHVQRKESFRRDDGTLDYELANRVNNLRTLCHEHHNQWEGIPVAPVPIFD